MLRVNGLLTKDVLKSIAYHLSGRDDCRGLEYVVTIYQDKETGNDAIEVSPYISVFPDVYKRKETDKRGIAYHVISQHFPEILQPSSAATVEVTHKALSIGTYRYTKLPTMKRRHWRRVPTNLIQEVIIDGSVHPFA